MLILADMPKPVHGMSNVNKAVLCRLNSKGTQAAVINTVPSYAAALFGGRFWTILKIFHTIYCWIKLIGTLFFSSVQEVYRPINGGSGQVYDLIYIGICRLFKKDIYIHHHSFNYLNSKSKLFELLNFIAGSKAKHIVLGDKMGGILSDLYDIQPEKITILSNVAFFEDTTKEFDDFFLSSHCLVIGHLANLCEEKGVDDFIALCRELKARNVEFIGKIAGPFANKSSEILIRASLDEFDEIEYYGGLYGEDKESFFKSLDAFIFPSKYRNEAEPLVLYEAGQYGVLNIGSRRGCMEDVINDLKGISIEEGPLMVTSMADTLQLQCNSGNFSAQSRSARINAFATAQLKAKSVLDNLFQDIVGK